MKAVVLEIKDNFIAILSDDGVVSKVKNNNYEVGQVIMMKENTIKVKSKKKLFAIASAAAVVTLVVLAGVLYNTPVSYVSLDVNPSVEYGVNLFDMVVDVTGTNDDGTELVEQLDVKGEKIEDAINQTVDELIESGYITDDENSGVVISAACDNPENAEKLALKLQTKTQAHINAQGKVALVEGIGVGKQRVEEARKLGVTPGKLNLVEKLKESSEDPDSIDLEEWLNKPVKEIKMEIKQNRGKGNNDNKSIEQEQEEQETSSETSSDVKLDDEKILEDMKLTSNEAKITSSQLQEKPNSDSSDKANAQKPDVPANGNRPGKANGNR